MLGGDGAEARKVRAQALTGCVRRTRREAPKAHVSAHISIPFTPTAAIGIPRPDVNNSKLAHLRAMASSV